MTQELRTLDFEVRQLKQSNSRLRNEADSERSQREKAESNALKLAEFIDVGHWQVDVLLQYWH